jgi:hypothetical protein
MIYLAFLHQKKIRRTSQNIDTKNSTKQFDDNFTDNRDASSKPTASATKINRIYHLNLIEFIFIRGKESYFFYVKILLKCA